MGPAVNWLGLARGSLQRSHKSDGGKVTYGTLCKLLMNIERLTARKNLYYFLDKSKIVYLIKRLAVWIVC